MSEQQDRLQELKTRLKDKKSRSTKSAYEKLTQLLTALLNEKPRDQYQYVDRFISKRENEPLEPNLEDIKFAKTQSALLIMNDEDDIENEAEETAMPIPNMLEHSFYFEQAGVGLANHEYIRISLALKQLTTKHESQSVRFWGKIFGLERDYYVAEVKLVEETSIEETDENESDGDESEAEVDQDIDPIPKSNFVRSIIPNEASGTGCNFNTYFVCNILGETWTRLPLVTPTQIQQARMVKKYLTGNLNAKIEMPFEGLEINYLRAQIARISASTLISPRGFYESSGDEGEEEEQKNEVLIKNEEFDGFTAINYTDSSNWTHHVKYILPQGRTKWCNPNAKKGNTEEEANEGEEEKEGNEKTQGSLETNKKSFSEYGPKLFTLISNDADIDEKTEAWSGYLSSNLMSKYSICIMKSNVWPGAFAYGIEKKFENIYVGWATKYSLDNHNPYLPSSSQTEYPINSLIIEAKDPSAQDEEDAREMARALIPQEENEQVDEDEDEAAQEVDNENDRE